MQHPPELILQLVDQWEHGADVVQMIRKDGPETRLVKRLTSRWFYHFLQRVGVVDLPAGASDYRLLSQRVAAVVRADHRKKSIFARSGILGWIQNRSFVVQAQSAPGRVLPLSLVNPDQFCLEWDLFFFQAAAAGLRRVGDGHCLFELCWRLPRDHLLFAGSDRSTGLVLTDCRRLFPQRRAAVLSRRHR